MQSLYRNLTIAIALIVSAYLGYAWLKKPPVEPILFEAEKPEESKKVILPNSTANQDYQ